MFQLSKIVRVSLVFLGLASSQLAHAWGDLGHQVIGEIAEQLIAQDVKTKDAIRAIIGIEPLAVSATWPDKVRSDGRFNDFVYYHFVTDFRDPKQRNEKDAFTVLDKFPALISNTTITREARMIAMRYLVHVVGDMQMPLHGGNEFDRGGNYCMVRLQQAPSSEVEILNLHETWDTNLVEILSEQYKKQMVKAPKYYGYKELAAQLIAKNRDLIDARVPKTDTRAWLAEDVELRKTVVYPDRLPEDQRPYCTPESKNLRPENMPLLDIHYINRALPVVERRLVLGGIRLAQMLKETLGGVHSTVPTEADILKILNLTNSSK